jgi:hypothetical protein
VPFGETALLIDPSESGKIGAKDQWVQVQTSGGIKGYSAAWLYKLATESAPPASPTPDKADQPAKLFVLPNADAINIRQRPINGKVLSQANIGHRLEVIDPVDEAKPKIGVNGQWIKVRTENGVEGFTAAWMYKIETS